MSTILLQRRRRTLRRLRQAMSSNQRFRRNQKIHRRLTKQLGLFRLKRIALYLANDGEVDLGDWISMVQKRAIKTLLPVLHPSGESRLLFAPYLNNEGLNTNCFGIAEPDLAHCSPVPLNKIDVVILPLVGFDADGHRLGMGGGYYDRTLASLRARPKRGPLLIGVGYECQRVARIPQRPWDVPLHFVVTESACYGHFSKKLGKSLIDRL
jgi:5-formyltetrahydrofolate cyclo-ligase